MDDDYARHLSDAEILEAMTKDLDSYFHLLVGKYWTLMLAVALWKLGNPQDAEEVTVDTFVQAYRSLPRLLRERRQEGRQQGEEQSIRLRPWLMAIVTNGSLNRMRYNKQQLRAPAGGSISVDTDEGRVFVEGTPYGQVVSAEEEAIQHENDEELYRLLEQLSPREQGIVDNHHIGGQTDSEVASTLGEKPDTIKKIRQRALKKLRELRDKMWQGVGGQE